MSLDIGIDVFPPTCILELSSNHCRGKWSGKICTTNTQKRVNSLIYQEVSLIRKTNATTLIGKCAKDIWFNKIKMASKHIISPSWVIIVLIKAGRFIHVYQINRDNSTVSSASETETGPSGRVLIATNFLEVNTVYILLSLKRKKYIDSKEILKYECGIFLGCEIMGHFLYFPYFPQEEFIIAIVRNKYLKFPKEG